MRDACVSLEYRGSLWAVALTRTAVGFLLGPVSPSMVDQELMENVERHNAVIAESDAVWGRLAPETPRDVRGSWVRKNFLDPVTCDLIIDEARGSQVGQSRFTMNGKNVRDSAEIKFNILSSVTSFFIFGPPVSAFESCDHSCHFFYF